MTDLYVWIPLSACLISSLSSLAILLRDPQHPGNRAAALLVGGGAWWAACQLLWTQADDAGSAMLYHRLSAFGWACIGPLALHLLSEVAAEPPRWMRRLLAPAYGVSALFAAMHLTTPWLHRNPSPAPWGWDFEAGPAHGAFFAFTMLCALPAVAVALRSLRAVPSPAERSQLQPLLLAVAVPLVFASLTGALLPLAGVPTPRLGPASFAVLGATVAWSYTRYGFSALAPGSFSREILETLPDGVALLALDGGVRNANGALERLLGVSAGELAGISIEQRLNRAVVDEADLREVECQLATPDGPIPVAISTSRLCDKRGLALGVVLVVRDLRELVGLRNRLATSGRLAAVGQLAAGIAHEINNPTAYVRANLAQLRNAWGELAKHLRHRAITSEQAALVAEGEELIDESLEGVERTASIVRDVKGFAHGGTGIIEEVDVNEILDEVLRMAQAQLPEGVQVEVRLSDVPGISGIPQELKQVFLNLVVNGIQAIDGEGCVEVTTRSEPGEVCVRVADDGCGISPEHRERIFDPFFTTKAVGEGTGLGLAISYQILRSHGAVIQLETEPRRGTAFTVRFRALVEPTKA